MMPHTHTLKHREIFIYIMRLSRKSMIGLPIWPKNGFREQGKEIGLGFLWWLNGGAEMSVPMWRKMFVWHQKKAYSGHLNRLTRNMGRREREVRFESCQQSNIKK